MGSKSGRPDPEYLNLVEDVFPSLTELFEAGEEVASLVTHPGWAHVSRLIEAASHGIDRKLDGALLPTRSDYAREHGKRAGLRAMAEAARAIVSKAEARRKEQQAKHEATAEPVALGA